MSGVTDAFAPLHRPGWPQWLRRELAPFPGRQAMTVRMVVTVVLVTIISMTLQTPETALSAYMVFFVTKENRVLTMVTGILMILGVTIAIFASLLLYRYTFDYPELRIPMMAATVFAGMYLSRVFVIGPLGFAIGFVVAITQSVAESVPDADLLVRGLLWLWAAVVYPIALTVLVNQILLPADPWTALARALTQRLDAVAAVLRRVAGEGVAGGQKNAALIELATRGSASLFALLKFAEMREALLKPRHASLASTIAASERMAGAAALLDVRTPAALTAADRLGIQTLLRNIEQLKTAVSEPDPVLPPGDSIEPGPALPELRELQLALASFRRGLSAETPVAAAPAPAKARKPLLVADAFTNPAHARFALKVALAAMSCYVLYTALDWPGIHTAFITCCFIALENTGASLRKGWLRLTGCAIGGLMGFLAILFLVPHLESIGSLVLLVAAGSALAGWVAAGSERLSYCGLQMGFAFYMCIFQGFAPGTDFETIRDRLAGIVLGIFVSTVVFRHIWPGRARDRLRTTLADTLRQLGRLLLLPQMGAAIESEAKAPADLPAKISKGLDESLRLSEVVVFEESETPDADGPTPATLAGIAEHAQTAYLIAIALAGETELAEWRRLEIPAREAEAALRASIARRLERIAACLESGRRQDSDDLDPAFAAWNRATAEAANDRGRLLRGLVGQVQPFA